MMGLLDPEIRLDGERAEVRFAQTWDTDAADLWEAVTDPDPVNSPIWPSSSNSTTSTCGSALVSRSATLRAEMGERLPTM